MSANLTNEPYTFANVRVSDPKQLLTITGERITYTPSSPPDDHTLTTINEIMPDSRILYPECCSQLLSHLIGSASGIRILDLSPGNCEFAIACNPIRSISYTGVDPREDLRHILEDLDIDTDRIMFVNSIAESGEEPYHILIVDLKDITTIPREKLSEDGIVIVRGMEETRANLSFGDCWALPFPTIYGTIGVRNSSGSCDALFLLANQRDRISLPEPIQGRISYLQTIPESILPNPPRSSMVSYGGKKVAYLGGNPFACVQYTTGITRSVGIIVQASTYDPIAYSGLYTKNFINTGGIVQFHIFEYHSRFHNRTRVYIHDRMKIMVHSHSSYNKCVEHAKYLFEDHGDIVGIGSDDEFIDLIANGIGRVMGYDPQMLIEIRGVYDLLAKGVAKAYPSADIRIAMDSCDPDTFTHIQSTRDGSKIYVTSTIGRKVPTMVIEPTTIEYPIREYTKDELAVIAESNLPQYSQSRGAGEGEGEEEFVPVSPPRE